MASTRKLRILVVDDDEIICATIRTILERSDYEVAVAEDGIAALRLVETWHPRAIVTDIVMPQQEGLHIIFQIRKLRPELPIVAMSGMRSGAYLPLAQKLGANAILAKPFDPASLLAKVRDVLVP